MNDFIRPIPLDNPVCRSMRQTVWRLDNALFNRNGSAGAGYRPTQYMLVLPYYAALATMVCYFYLSFTSKITDDQVLYYLLRGGSILLGANMLLMLPHALRLPGLPKRLLYLFFTSLVTGVFYSIMAFLMIWLASCFLMVIIVMAVIGGAFGKKGYSSEPETPYRESVVVDDGSLWGKTLTREDGGDWHDGATAYEETSEGFRRK